MATEAPSQEIESEGYTLVNDVERSQYKQLPSSLIDKESKLNANESVHPF